MITVDIKLDAAGALKILREDFLLKVPVEVLARTEGYLREVMAMNMNLIRRKRVRRGIDALAAGSSGSKWGSTYEWRLRMARRGRKVKTLEGAEAPVIPNIKAGMRTGTLLGQVEKSSAPTVKISKSILGPDLVMKYSIDAGKYDRSYPLYFHQWISEVKGIEGGLLPDEADEERMLDIFSEDILNWFGRQA